MRGNLATIEQIEELQREEINRKAAQRARERRAREAQIIVLEAQRPAVGRKSSRKRNRGMRLAEMIGRGVVRVGIAVGLIGTAVLLVQGRSADAVQLLVMSAIVMVMGGMGRC